MRTLTGTQKGVEEVMTDTVIRTRIETTMPMRLVGSWGETEFEDVEMRLNIRVNLESGRGSFEWYDIEMGGGRYYAEGGLWFSESINDSGWELSDYDGVYALPHYVQTWLDENDLISPDPDDWHRRDIDRRRGDA
jgi:hypothetical protein